MKLSITRKIIKVVQFILTVMFGLVFWGFISGLLNWPPDKSVWIALPVTVVLVGLLAVAQSRRDITLMKRKLEAAGVDPKLLNQTDKE